MALGRISGPLLKSNLLRNGVDLAFETNLLYLDVTNRRVGINTGTPSHDLQVNGTARVNTLTVDTTSTLGQLTFTSNSINSATSQINLNAGGSNPVVYQGKLQVGDLQLTGNTFSTLNLNEDINFTTTGTGKVNINSNLTVTGNIYAQGNLTVDGTVTIGGNITVGNQATDTISITAGIASDMLPINFVSTLIGASISVATPGILTFSSTTGDTVRTGMWLSGGNVTPGTYIVSGSGTTWTLNQAATGTPTTATYSYNLGSSTLTWNNVYANSSYFNNINVTNFQSGNLAFTNNTITDTVNNADIQFATTGTGGIVLGNIKVNANNITNTVSNAVTTFNNSTASTSFTGSIANGTSVTFTASVSGNTLTVTSAPSGAGIVVGQAITGGTIPTGVYIVSNLTGTGTSSSSTWTVSTTFTQTSTTVTARVVTLTVTAGVTNTIYSGMVLTGSTVSAGTVIISQNTATSAAVASPTYSSGGAVNAYTFVVSSGTSISKGQFVTGTGVPANTFVSVVSGTSVTLSKPFTVQATGTYNFYTPGTIGTYYVSVPQTASSQTIAGTVTGYVYIGGTNGVVIPAGTTLQRAGNPQAGMMRFNTDNSSLAVEIYTGTSWSGVAGASAGITVNQATDTSAQWALTLG
jgi:hypothetical protein